MESEKILSQDGAQHLMEAVSIATELRLRTYANNDTREETLSTFIPAVEHLTDEHKHKLLKEIFHFQDTSILHHFYYVMLRVQEITEGFCQHDQHYDSELTLKTDMLFADTDYIKGMIHARFLEYDRALDHMKAAKEEKPKDSMFLKDLWLFYNKTGVIEELINVGNERLELSKNKHKDNPNHLDIAIIHNNLGLAYAAKGDYEKAIKYYQDALSVMLEAYKQSPNHTNIANNYNSLGNVYSNKGEYERASKYYQDALKIRLKAYKQSPNHPDIAGSYNNLGNAYLNKGDYEKAIKYYHHASEILLKVYEQSPNRPDLAQTYTNLGNVYLGKGDYEKAIKYHLHASEIWFKTYETIPNHPDIAISYNNLGNIFLYKGDYEQASKYYQDALEIRLEAYKQSPNHPGIAISYNNLGSAYGEKGDYEQAIKYCQDALNIELESYKQNPNHPDIAKSYNNLGNVFFYNEDYEQAIKYHQKALKIRLKVYEQSPNHPNIATSYDNLGNAYQEKGEYKQAIKYHQKALEIRLKAYKQSPNHPDIALSYNNLGALYSDVRDYEQAVKYCRATLNIRLEVYKQSPNHPDIATSYNHLGNAYLNKGEYEQAHYCAQKSLEIYLNCQAPKHTPTSKNLYNMSLLQLGNLALLAEDEAKAKSFYEQINPQNQYIDFDSKEFFDLQIQYINTAYKNKNLLVAITCQKILIKIDPELKYGNLYHALACFYACQGNIEGANEEFTNALTHPNAKITSDLYAEYAQFLLANKKSAVLKVALQAVSKHLYAAINYNNTEGLEYGKIEKDSICDILQNLIKQKNSTIQVNPKALAYYLLISNPEYIKDGDSIEFLLGAFKSYCDNLRDEISFHLLSAAYKSVGNEEVAEKYYEFAELIEQVDSEDTESEVTSLGDNSDEPTKTCLII
jgi:tetratricopeptide (TPR) repeat protein